MVLQGISNIFSKNKPKNRPMLNEIPHTFKTGKVQGFSNDLLRKKQFWQWFRTRPELNSPVMIRVNDTITEVEFLSPEGNVLGRNKHKQAKDFWYKNQMYERLKSLQFDRLLTGDGYLFKASINNMRESDKEDYMKGLKKVCYKTAKARLGPVNTRETEVLADQIFMRFIDEDSRITRLVDYVASSTVEVVHNGYDVTGYVQHYATGIEEFNKEDIIHIPLYRVDGRVEGFTPVESLHYELLLLWTIKENMLAYFRNGGVPSRIFILPEEIANSENHQWLTEKLMNDGILENRHGNLVLTGNVDVKDLETNIKDMEYKELAKYILRNIAYSLHVPETRVPIDGAKSDAGGLSESGYWSVIESDQRTLEMHINQQLLNPLGFSIRFKRSYKIDDVREAQAKAQWASVIAAWNNIYAQQGKRIRTESLNSLLSGYKTEVCDDDLEDVPKEESVQDVKMLNKQFLKDSEVLPERAGQNKAETKKAETENNPSGTTQSGY